MIPAWYDIIVSVRASIIAIAVSCVVLAGCGSTKQLTRAQMRDYAAAVNLRLTDLPEMVAHGSEEESYADPDSRFFACLNGMPTARDVIQSERFDSGRLAPESDSGAKVVEAVWSSVAFYGTHGEAVAALTGDQTSRYLRCVAEADENRDTGLVRRTASASSLALDGFTGYRLTGSQTNLPARSGGAIERRPRLTLDVLGFVMQHAVIELTYLHEQNHSVTKEERRLLTNFRYRADKARLP